MSEAKKDSGGLSGLGKKIEASLAALLRDIDADLKKTNGEPRQYSLTDRMKVMDRCLKLESIKARIEEPEGSFFEAPTGGASDEA